MITSAENVLVFADRGSRQCESAGISAEESAEPLHDAGIDVLRSMCGVKTGVAFTAVCGAETGEILLHEIRGVSLSSAESLGYRAASTLVDRVAGTGYEQIDCVD